MNNINPSSEAKTKKITLRFICAWVFGVIIFISGFVIIFSHVMPGLLFILASLILLPPAYSFIEKKIKRSLSVKVRSVIIVILLIIGVAMTPTTPNATPSVAQPSVNTPVATANTNQTPVATPQAPLTDKQKVQNAVQSLIQNQSSQFPSIKAVDIQGDPSLPKGMTYVTIDIETGTFWDDSATVTETGQLASQIMQQVFPISSAFHDVLVRYYGQLIDKYGNTSDGMMLSYDINQTLYKKINWANFSDTQNDIHLCGFIREYSNTLDQADQDQDAADGSNSCTIMLKSLQKAENSIETSNPQFSDIPQYN